VEEVQEKGGRLLSKEKGARLCFKEGGLREFEEREERREGETSSQPFF